MTLRRLVRRSSRRRPGRRTGRLGRQVRRLTATALGPVLAASGAVLPAVPAAAVAAGAVAAATAASVATAAPAKAATGAPVLVLVQNGESSAPEATLLAAAGYSVTPVTPATWAGMSQAQFAQYAALVIGDPSSGGSCSSLTPTTGSSGSDALGTAWQPAVTGNVAVLGTAPVQAGTTAASTLITDSVGYAAAGFDSANSSGTGLYVSLNCEYSAASTPADVSLLDGVDGIGGAGGLAVQGGLSCTDPGTVNTWETARTGTFTGFTSSSLSASAWGSACPVEEAFTRWPAMFTPAAYDAASDAADDFTASDGATGQPYILLGAPVSPATAALAPSAGGEVLGGTTAGGTSNPAAPGVKQGSAGDPVNTEDGSFTQSYTDLSLPGFGPALGFTRSYDSTQAEKQTQAGTPGPMGYGWTDNWATSLSAAEPAPGDIYAAEGLRTGNGNGGDAVGSVARTPDGITFDGAGNAYFADTGDNRIQEVPAVSGPQWGVDMIAGNVYTVAGQADGQSEEPLDGGLADGIPALQAVLHQPQGVAVDPSGDLFIADTGTCRILEVQPTGDNGTGVISTFAGSLGNCQYGGDGGPATAAGLNHPTSIHFGQASGQTRDLYIADSGDNRIREIPASSETLWGVSGMQAGHIYTVAGTGVAGHSAENQPARNSQLSNPQGVTLNGGVMYIADTGNCRIAVVPQNPGTYFNVSVPASDDLATVSGRAGQCGIGNDNKQATQSDLENPTAVRDPDGNLYITDSGQDRVPEGRRHRYRHHRRLQLQPPQ